MNYIKMSDETLYNCIRDILRLKLFNLAKTQYYMGYFTNLITNKYFKDINNPIDIDELLTDVLKEFKIVNREDIGYQWILDNQPENIITKTSDGILYRDEVIE